MALLSSAKSIPNHAGPRKSWSTELGFLILYKPRQILFQHSFNLFDRSQKASLIVVKGPLKLLRPYQIFHEYNGVGRVLFADLMQAVGSQLTEKLSATMSIAKRVYSLAQEQHDSALMIGACRAFAVTLYFLGDFEVARQYATCGLQILPSIVSYLRPYLIGISVRPPVATRPWQKPSRWRKS